MAQPPSPEHSSPPARAAARPRWGLELLALACALACALAAVLVAGRGQLAGHQAWWFGAAGADLAPRYAALSPAMDEAALQRHFAGTALVCADGGAPGERRCEAPLSRADGVPAARLQALLVDGHLRAVEIWVPWWEHHSATRSLVASLGAPASHDTPDGNATDLGSIAWELPGATLRIARHPGWNPWQWTRLRWAAKAPP